MVTAEYDRDADALYVRLADTPVARSITIDDSRVLDVDAAGNVVGIEVIAPAENLTITPIARMHGFADKIDEIDKAVQQTELGHQLKASPTMVFVSLVWERPWLTAQPFAAPSSIAAPYVHDVVTAELSAV